MTLYHPNHVWQNARVDNINHDFLDKFSIYYITTHGDSAILVRHRNELDFLLQHYIMNMAKPFTVLFDIRK